MDGKFVWLADPSANQAARVNFLLRASVIFFAVISIIPPAAMLGQFNGMATFPHWRANDRVRYYPYVCQLAADRCDTGGKVSGAKCFRLGLVPHFQTGDKGLPYEGARADCASKQGVLASIANEQENADVLSVCGQDNQPCWIGLSKEDAGSAWAWEDGTPVSFSKWADGEPDSDSGSYWGGGAAVISLQDYASEKSAAIVGLVFLHVNILCLCSYCFCFYQGVQWKNPCCVLTAGSADSCCALLAIVALVITIIGVSVMKGSGKGAGVASIVLTLIELILLCAVAACTFWVSGPVQQEVNAQRPRMQIVSAPVYVGQAAAGTVVVGQPVTVQCATAQAHCGPPIAQAHAIEAHAIEL